MKFRGWVNQLDGDRAEPGPTRTTASGDGERLAEGAKRLRETDLPGDSGGAGSQGAGSCIRLYGTQDLASGLGWLAGVGTHLAKVRVCEFSARDDLKRPKCQRHPFCFCMG